MLSKSAAIVRKEVGCQALWPLRVQSVPRLSATTPGSTPGMSQDELMPIKTKAPDIKPTGLGFEWERGHLLSPQHTHPSLPPLRTPHPRLPSGHTHPPSVPQDTPITDPCSAQDRHRPLFHQNFSVPFGQGGILDALALAPGYFFLGSYFCSTISQLADVMHIGGATLESSYELPLNTQRAATIQPSHGVPEFFSQQGRLVFTQKPVHQRL